MSNGRLFRKTAPAQRGSGISILEVLGILRSLGILGEQPKEQYGCAQPDSENSILPENQTLHSLHELHGEKMFSAQRGSENSKLDFPLCLAGCQASPAMRDDSVVKAVQRDSGNSKLKVES